MSIAQQFIQQPATSNLFGILEGKRRAKIEDEKRKTMETAAAMKLKTADVDAAATAASTNLENIKIEGNNKMYLILGVVLVLVVGIAVYFKFRKK